MFFIEYLILCHVGKKSYLYIKSINQLGGVIYLLNNVLHSFRINQFFLLNKDSDLLVDGFELL